MKTYRLSLDKDYTISEVDPHIYSSFMEHVGQVVYGGLYNPEHPTADEQGFRRDVIEAVKELNIPAIRYPGGNFVSNFDWKDSIGPREKRPTRLDLAYLAIEDNSMGLDEYVDWARKTNTEVMYTLNLGTPDCAKDAGSLMDYCNFSGGTYWSDLRIQNGHKMPHNIKTWCLGNEMDGPWQLNTQTAYHYGLRACETAKIMKWTDPQAELIAVGSSNPETQYPEWTRIMLEQCYDHVDYLSIHRYWPLKENQDDNSPDIKRYLGMGVEYTNFIDVIASTIDYVKAKKKSSHKVYLSFDEYAPVGGPPLHLLYAATDGNPRAKERFQKGSPVFEMRPPKTLLDALAVGSMMIGLINSSDKVKIACSSILLQSFIRAFKGEPVVKQTLFYPFQHASLYGRGEAIRGVVESPVHKTKLISYSKDEEIEIPLIQSASAYDPEHNLLNVFILNADEERIELSMDLRSFGEAELQKHIVLDGDDPYAYNDVEHPYRVVPHTEKNSVCGRTGTVNLSPRSWNVLRFVCKS